MRGKYLPKSRLAELDRILSDKDKAILSSLQSCRYLTSNQISRLHFYDYANDSSGLRSTQRNLVKLRDYGMIEPLDRRIGGVRAGSGSYIWTLTESGNFLLHLGDEDYAPRKRFFEPTLNFLKHTLGVSETLVQLTEICRQQSIVLKKAELEPKCWRNYTGPDSALATMKPDMYAVTVNTKYEDSWFIEVDMNTQSPSVVLNKCLRYVLYCKSGLEQRKNGVFPLIVWLVYSTNRKAKIQEYIADCLEMSEKSKSLFIVIMPDEFETLIINGAEALCKKGAQHEN